MGFLETAATSPLTLALFGALALLFGAVALGLRRALHRARESEAALRREIAERRALEEREHRLVQELERKVEDLDAFTHRVSHDLKAPLRSLRGWCDVLEDALEDVPDATARELLGRVTRCAGNMETLISRLLSLSRVGRAAVVRRPVPLREIVGDVRSDLSAALRERRAVLHLLDEDAEVVADGGLLAEVFTNLVGNAVKFNERPAPCVRVGSRALHDGGRALYVADDGIGVPADERDRIFRVFERAHGNGYEGTGAGLAICRRIVEAHGGRIWVEPNDDGGSTFLFTLGPDGVREPPAFAEPEPSRLSASA